MKKSRLAITLIFMLCLLLNGCGRGGDLPSEPLQCRVVTGIRVSFTDGPLQMERYYTASEKMRAVLNYLRWIDPYGRPEEDPETVSGSSYHIVLTYSDGCEKTYEQKADRFMQVDGQGWKRIDPKRALTLSQMLGQMASDERT